MQGWKISETQMCYSSFTRYLSCASPPPACTQVRNYIKGAKSTDGTWVKGREKKTKTTFLEAKAVKIWGKTSLSSFYYLFCHQGFRCHFQAARSSSVDKQPEEVKAEGCWQVPVQLRAMAQHTRLRLKNPVSLIRMQKWCQALGTRSHALTARYAEWKSSPWKATPRFVWWSNTRGLLESGAGEDFCLFTHRTKTTQAPAAHASFPALYQHTFIFSQGRKEAACSLLSDPWPHFWGCWIGW